MAAEVEGEKVWFNVEETALYLGVSVRWVRRAIAERTVDFNKLGGLIRFHADTLDAILEAGQVPAERELPVVGGTPGNKPKAKTKKQRRRRAA